MAQVRIVPLSDGMKPVELVFDMFDAETRRFVTHRVPIEQANEVPITAGADNLKVRYEGLKVDSFARWELRKYNNMMQILVGSRPSALAAEWLNE